MTPFQKSAKLALESQSNACPDRIVIHKDGTLSAKRAYFFGLDGADHWAGRIAAELTAAGISATVDGRNDFANWPKTSYYVAIIKEA